MRYISSILLTIIWLNAYSQSEVQTYNGRNFTVAECLAFSAEKEKAGDIKESTRFLNMAAEICWDAKKYDEAIGYYTRSYDMNKSIGNENGMAMIAGNLGMIYNDIQKYEDALRYFEYNLKVRKAYKEKNSVIASLINIAVVLNNLRRHKDAEVRLSEALKLATEQSDVSQMRMCYGMLAETTLKAGEQEKSKEYYDLYRTFHELETRRKETAFTEDAENARLQTKITEVEKRNKELELQVKERQLQEKDVKIQEDNQEIARLTRDEIINRWLKSENEKKLAAEKRKVEKAKEKAANDALIRNLLIAGLLMTIVFSSVVLVNFLQKRRKNRELAARNAEINQQRDEIARQNMEIFQRNREIEKQNQEIKNQYKELAEARNIIEEQNDLLQNYNRSLEKQVELRTKELKDSNEELIFQNSQLEQYAYVTAHNLRGPLARMLGLIYIFNNKDITDEINLTVLEKIQHEVVQLDEVIKDLNRILEVRHKAGNNLEFIDLGERINFVRESFKDEIKQYDIQVNVDLEQIRHIYFVKAYLDSILYNLFSNCIKYHHPERKPLINIKSEAFSKDFVCVSVSDNGLGIDLKQYGSKVFGLYKRFHLHREGKGLGLFLIKTQIEILGGKIKIQSQVNEGTTMKLFFKVSQPIPSLQEKNISEVTSEK
jgi:signal transduction histidine kinase